MIETEISSGDMRISISLRFYELVKRAGDIVFSLILLLFTLPILVVVAFWVALDSKGPVFFRQTRIGKGGNAFKIIKFRTMVTNAESMGPQVTSVNDHRITRSGRILRAWKLDEFPQFLNVLIGDMSLVGPRPQVPRYVGLFPPRQKEKILSVRPGITGPTTLLFRHEEEMLQNKENREQFYIDVLLPIKCNLDESYVDSRSLLADWNAVMETAFMLVRGVINRLRRIPVGETIEYPIPEFGQTKESSSLAVANLIRSSVLSSEDDLQLEQPVID